MINKLTLENKNNKFKIIEKKLSREFDISKQELFELLNNNRDFTQSFASCLVNLFLGFLSLLGIIITKLKKINKSHYFIIPANSNYPYKDKRSEIIFLKIPISKTFNIIKCRSFKKSIFFFFRYPNTLFYNSFLCLILYFNYKFSKDFMINYNNYHKCLRLYSKILEKILNFLKIKKFFLIDDHQTSCFFQRITRKQKITSIGYMHGRFNIHQYGLFYDVFDYYLIWDLFFKKKLLKLNKKYLNKKILFIRNPNLKKIKIASKSKYKKNILYVYEENINYNNIIKILNEINKFKDIKLKIKLRENAFINEKILNFCNVKGIQLIYETDLSRIFEKTSYDIVLGHNSTLLYEAIYYDVLPLRINDNSINHFNYIDDRFINNVGINLDKLKVYLYTNNSNKLTFLQKKIWKYHFKGFPKKNDKELNSIFS
jgi:hypothetical protein